jgi:hypothetical protein
MRLSQRDLKAIRQLGYEARECHACSDVHYVGMPGMFVYLYIPHAGGPGTHRVGTAEEFAAFFHGCPACGEEVKTYPMIMPGLHHTEDGPIEHGQPAVPDPWPISEWGPVTQGNPDEYHAQINELW